MLETYNMPQFPGVAEYTPEYTTLFQEWCKRTHTLYYGRPKEEFSVYEARELAIEANALILLLDNMS